MCPRLGRVSRLLLLFALPYTIFVSLYINQYNPSSNFDRWSASHLAVARPTRSALGFRSSYIWPETSPNQIDIVVVQSNPDHYWCTCAKPAMESYALRHGYGLTWATPSQGVAGAKMMKYSLASELLGPDGIVVIADCDVFVTNPRVRVEDVWREWAHEGTQVVVSRDAHWGMKESVPINSGLILLKGGEYSDGLLRVMLEKGRVDKEGKWKGRFNVNTLVDQPRLTVSFLETNQLDDPPSAEFEVRERGRARAGGGWRCSRERTGHL